MAELKVEMNVDASQMRDATQKAVRALANIGTAMIETRRAFQEFEKAINLLEEAHIEIKETQRREPLWRRVLNRARRCKSLNPLRKYFVL